MQPWHDVMHCTPAPTEALTGSVAVLLVASQSLTLSLTTCPQPSCTAMSHMHSSSSASASRWGAAGALVLSETALSQAMVCSPWDGHPIRTWPTSTRASGR